MKFFLIPLLLIGHIAFAKDISSKSYIIQNLSTGEIVSTGNSSDALPIASITKLMTALIVIDSQKPLNELLQVPKSGDTSSRIKPGLAISREELIRLALIASDNKAAKTLAIHDNENLEEFVDKMNAKALELGMTHTHYVDPSGIGSGNVSTVEDLIILLNTVKFYSQFNIAAATPKMSLLVRTKNKILHIVGINTNPLAGKEYVQIAKTGFTNAAGFCIATIIRINKQEYVVVLLGNPSKKERMNNFNQAMAIIKSGKGV